MEQKKKDAEYEREIEEAVKKMQEEERAVKKEENAALMQNMEEMLKQH